MTKPEFGKERDYAVAVSVLKSWLKSGIIDGEDYSRAELALRKKYRPYREFPLDIIRRKSDE